MENWFTIDAVGEDTHIISEYRHWEETHCYLLEGTDGSLLIDTGLGICDISVPVAELTSKPVTAAVTHVHWDHIGGLPHFPDFCAHAAELDWLSGGFPLPVEAIREMVVDRCELPEGFDAGSYEFFRGTPSRLLEDGDVIDLGHRRVEALHTPGHSPGHLCFFERERGWLYTGDLVYKGTLLAFYPSTDPEAYLASLERLASLPVTRVFPAHHSLETGPELITEMRDALRALRDAGQLRHGSGTHDFGEWAIRL